MKIFPVSLVIFHRFTAEGNLEVWTQTRTDDGPFHGLQEFPGGGVEANESPLDAAVREVEEEVGISIKGESGRFMGVYSNPLPHKNILLYVHLFPDNPDLKGKGAWLSINGETLSSPYVGKIPGPNHKIIDELYQALKA